MVDPRVKEPEEFARARRAPGGAPRPGPRRLVGRPPWSGPGRRRRQPASGRGVAALGELIDLRRLYGLKEIEVGVEALAVVEVERAVRWPCGAWPRRGRQVGWPRRLRPGDLTSISRWRRGPRGRGPSRPGSSARSRSGRSRRRDRSSSTFACHCDGMAWRMLRSTTSAAFWSSCMLQPVGRNGNCIWMARSTSRRDPPSRAR